ncbi:hypothetical protein Taro_020533 [Colocasia esculenta]|uniref:BURP domain-containing protein n=1 Tax=Colocasia esculenta TaxID=4460 RepID=A0A843UWL4_COLES|nr:hypothetical protein [Colocasia esculenta]
MPVGVQSLVAEGENVIACHAQLYPYAVFFCHGGADATKVYKVKLVGEDGGREWPFATPKPRVEHLVSISVSPETFIRGVAGCAVEVDWNIIISFHNNTKSKSTFSHSESSQKLSADSIPGASLRHPINAGHALADIAQGKATRGDVKWEVARTTPNEEFCIPT